MDALVWIGVGVLLGWLLRGLTTNGRVYFLTQDLGRALNEIARLEQVIEDRLGSEDFEAESKSGWYGNDLGGES